MSFFKQFPKVEYDFNRTGVSTNMVDLFRHVKPCLLYTSPSPRDRTRSRMPSSA